jgi:antitoxin VapB
MEEEPVATTKVFRSGNSQAVRLPKEFQFDVNEVEIYRRGEEVVLRRKPLDLASAFGLLAGLPDDFMAEGRKDSPPQEREAL